MENYDLPVPLKFLRFRLLMLAAAVGFLTVALAVRVVAAGALNSPGSLEQYSGTALYGSMTYVGILFFWPRLRSLPAGAIAMSHFQPDGAGQLGWR